MALSPKPNTSYAPVRHEPCAGNATCNLEWSAPTAFGLHVGNCFLPNVMLSKTQEEEIKRRKQWWYNCCNANDFEKSDKYVKFVPGVLTGLEVAVGSKDSKEV